MQKKHTIAMLLVLVASACSDGSVVAPGGGSGGPPADAWVWQNVAPFANDFIALESLGSGEAIALTRHDGLMTRDGGNSWQELPLDEFFYDIHRRGDLVSILTGGRVQLSTDRGGSWRSTAPHSVGRRAAAFWDENNGIVVGTGDIATTDDGGETWTERFPGAFTRVPILHDVEYLDASTIFAVGTLGGSIDLVLRSDNGGANWSRVSIPNANVSIEAIDITAGAMRAVDAVGRVHSSADRGLTWLSFDPVAGSSAPFYDVDFANASDGVIAGYGGNLHTTGNGISWTPVATGVTTDINAVAYGPSGELWAAGEGGRIYRSTDGGDNWSSLHTGHRFEVRDVSFANPNVGLAVGAMFLSPIGLPRCGVMWTDDGGRTWNRSNVGTSLILCQAGNLNAVAMLDENNVVIVGDGGSVWTSDDGGRTWALRDPDTSDDLYDVDFVDNKRGIVVGANGRKRTTGDGGETWTAGVAGTNTSETINAVSFSSRNIAMLAGDEGVVRRTANGGQTWAIVDDGLPNCDFVDVVALDDTTAVLLGTSNMNRVFRTTDAGESWVETHKSGGSKANALAFGSATRGYFVTDNGEARLTQDGGITWQLISMPTARDLLGVHAVSDLIVTIVGEGGTVLRTETGGR